MGMEAKHIDASTRLLYSEEQVALDYLKWIADTVGAKNDLVRYIAEMLILEIRETPTREADGQI